MKDVKEILKQCSLLYAEDDIPVQKYTLQYLNRYFGTIHIANNGKEALDIYKTLQPDILFLDIDMPFIDGLSVAKTVRESDEKTPIIMLTAYLDTDKLLQATELHLCKYLVKPFEHKEFKSTLRKLSEYFKPPLSELVALKKEYYWNKTKKELYCKQQPVPLTQKEKALLALLISKQNQCVSFLDIQAHVWEEDLDAEVSIQSVKLQVTLLRKKLPEGSITNIYGKGYILYN